MFISKSVCSRYMAPLIQLSSVDYFYSGFSHSYFCSGLILRVVLIFVWLFVEYLIFTVNTFDFHISAVAFLIQCYFYKGSFSIS